MEYRIFFTDGSEVCIKCDSLERKRGKVHFYKKNWAGHDKEVASFIDKRAARIEHLEADGVWYLD